jgi:Na+-driven multidrug efflux pump
MVAILRAGGDGKTGFYTDLVVMWMICIPLAWMAAFRWHAEPWVVVAIIKSIIALEAIVALIRIHQYHWVRNLTEERVQSA